MLFPNKIHPVFQYRSQRAESQTAFGACIDKLIKGQEYAEAVKDIKPDRYNTFWGRNRRR